MLVPPRGGVLACIFHCSQRRNLSEFHRFQSVECATFSNNTDPMMLRDVCQKECPSMTGK